mmetsp:Transcript_32012/g.55738  ORF Transcript_32012/g.55738 Transcript_32012/m.55738 type:complete len:86 (+) Transcript_32012:229-486(+)
MVVCMRQHFFCTSCFFLVEKKDYMPSFILAVIIISSSNIQCSPNYIKYFISKSFTVAKLFITPSWAFYNLNNILRRIRNNSKRVQ